MNLGEITALLTEQNDIGDDTSRRTVALMVFCPSPALAKKKKSKTKKQKTKNKNKT
jgi:hypothetical protein